MVHSLWIPAQVIEKSTSAKKLVHADALATKREDETTDDQ